MTIKTEQRLAYAVQDLLTAMRDYLPRLGVETITPEVHAVNVALRDAGFTPIFPSVAAFERMAESNWDVARIAAEAQPETRGFVA